MKETKFKQTEIGMIPDDWEVKELVGICKITSGESPSRFCFSSSGTPYFKVEQMNNCLKYQKETPYYILGNKKVEKGTIIFPKRGAAIETNKIRILYNDSFFDTNIMGLTIDKSVNNEYFYYWLVRKELWKIADTTSVPQINNKHINPLLLPLPPTLAEQQKIAKALSDVDNVITTLEKLITKKKNLKQGTMQQLLTGKKRLPGFAKSDKFKQTEIGEIPEDWEVKSFEELFDICTSTISLNFVKTAFYVGTENMLPNRGGVLNYENELNYLSIREYKKEDILFSNIRPYLKKLWLANHNGGCSTDVLVFRKKNKDDSALFLYMLISDDRFFQIVNDNAIGTKMPRGDKNIIKQIKFCLPSKLEQTAIANVLSSMDKEIEALEAKLGKCRDLKTGMMQQLLTGKIRLM